MMLFLLMMAGAHPSETDALSRYMEMRWELEELRGTVPPAPCNLLNFFIGEGLLLKGGARPAYRAGTSFSSKWRSGVHNIGCVMSAPDWFCTCREFDIGAPLR